MGLSNELSSEAGRFSCSLNPHRYFHSEALRLYFPELGPWVVGLSCFPVIPTGLSARKCGTSWSSSRHLAASPLHPAAHPLPFLLLWMNVFSLTPWLLDFRMVWFFVFKFVVVLLVV